MTYEYKVGEWYKTRVGYEAQVFGKGGGMWGGLKVFGKIKVGDQEERVTWCGDGSFYSKETQHKYDLMPPVERKELWVNIHSEHAVIWRSKEDAEYLAGPGRIGMMRIVIEGDDFTVEKVTG
jgi:hypothetical protein